jgi:hypothetical protein
MTGVQFNKAKRKNLNKRTWGLIKMTVQGKDQYFDLDKGINIVMAPDEIIQGPEISSRLAMYLIDQSKQKHE